MAKNTTQKKTMAPSKKSTSAKQAKKTTRAINAGQAKSVSKKVQAPLSQTVDARVEKNEAKSWNVPPVAQTLKRPQVFLPIIGLIIIALLAYIFRSWFVVATVNGQLITRAELNKELTQQYGKEVLDSVITKTLILQEANKQHVSVNQSDIDASLKQISDSLSKQGQSLDSVLAARGMTRQDLVDQIKLQKTVEKLVGKDVKVSDEEVNKYIETNKDTLPTGLSDEQLKQQVKQQLLQQKINDKAQALVSDLQKKAQINYVASF